MAVTTEELLAEWIRETIGITKHVQKEVNDCRAECSKCKEKVNTHLAELDKKLAVNSIKIAIIVGGGVLVIAEIVRHWFDK